MAIRVATTPVQRFLDFSSEVDGCRSSIVLLLLAAQGDDLSHFKLAIAKLWSHLKAASPVVCQFEQELHLTGAADSSLFSIPGGFTCASMHEAVLEWAKLRWLDIWQEADEPGMLMAIAKLRDEPLDDDLPPERLDEIDLANAEVIDEVWREEESPKGSPNRRSKLARPICQRWEASKKIIADFPAFNPDVIAARLDRERAIVAARIAEWPSADDIDQAAPAASKVEWSDYDTQKRMAARLNISPDTLRRKIKAGEIRAEKSGQRIRIDKRHLS